MDPNQILLCAQGRWKVRCPKCTGKPSLVRRFAACARCGWRPAACPKCNGTGIFTYPGREVVLATSPTSNASYGYSPDRLGSCDDCYGTGLVGPMAVSVEECRVCFNIGKWTCSECKGTGGKRFLGIRVWRCSACRGTGQKRCRMCDGMGSWCVLTAK